MSDSKHVPDWQLPSGVCRGLWEYTRSEHIAYDFDDEFATSGLLEYDERERCNYQYVVLEVGAEFIGRARLPGVVAGHGEPVAERGTGALEAADIVALPAVHRNRDPRRGAERAVAVPASSSMSVMMLRPVREVSSSVV